MALPNEVVVEFMRKHRFEKIRDKIESIAPEAEAIINSAKSEEILELTMTFTNPKVINADIIDERKFIELAF
ncbi:MAG: hypothetical protein JXC85_00530 [Candidatus Aenigmarchaeota archaeon]|nr:hypothetical protein [Candidatus Aenigmarchaeota archaeon]